jgi:hypothetical protein
MGLFVFASSSAFFTSVKYADSLPWRPYWTNKIHRLAPGFLVCNGLLLGAFLLQGRGGVWSWQTLANLLGLNGFLDWFGLGNPSPIGRGLWFFTLLLLFYAAYPLLRRIGRTRLGTCAMLMVGFLAAVVLEARVPMGHALWLTAFGFVYGVVSHRLGTLLRASVSGPLALAAVGATAAARFLMNAGWLNYPLIAVVSMLVVEFLKDVETPGPAIRLGKVLSKPLLEIYILHPYLYVHPTGHRLPDMLASIVCIVGAAWAVRGAIAWARRSILKWQASPPREAGSS